MNAATLVKGKGTQGASAKSIEMVRTFLIELAQGEHQDTLKRPGGNRKS